MPTAQTSFRTPFGEKFHDYPARLGKRSIYGHFVYILWKNDEPVYVGATSSLVRRIREHGYRARRELGFYEFDSATIKGFDSIASARKEEARLVRLLHPEHNTKLRNPSSFLNINLLAVLGVEEVREARRG